MKIIGHRGANGYEPENTLRSIVRAIELGADIIEFDVITLPTGEIILMHDDRVDRTTNGTGRVLDIPFEQLRKLDAGQGERIPTLQEALDVINRRARVNIEIKGSGSAKAVTAVISEYIARGWQAQDFIIASFHHPELFKCKQLLPQIATAALLYSVPLDYAAFCEPLKADIVAPATDIVTPEFVADAHRRGILVYAWVWQPVFDEEVRDLYAMRVDGIYADYIDRDRGIVATMQKSYQKHSTR